MTTVLVIDDERRIARLVRDYLDQAGFRALEAHDGNEAVQMFRDHRPDLLIVDLGLPGMDGLDVIRQVRTVSDVPIIILSARSDETDRVVGLELGADDYVVKPFGPKELVARVRALLRRVEGAGTGDGEMIRVAEVEVDVPKMRVTVGGVEIDLTPTEFQLVVTMATQPGRVFTRGQLLDAIHGISFESYERAVDAHVKNIRRKFGSAPRKPQYILTVHGVGYKFTDG